MLGLAKKAEFREDHRQPKEKKSNKKEIAEDVMMGGVGLKAGSIAGGSAGAVVGKRKPLANPVGIDTVKTRTARNLVNSALHNQQAKKAIIKGGALGAATGLGLAGAGMAYNHFHQQKTASENPENPELPREHNSHDTLGQTLDFVERAAVPKTRHEAIMDIFSNNQLQKYENIASKPILFGKHQLEADILKPKKHTLDAHDKGDNYHPIMQGATKHWSIGEGFHAKKS